MWQDLGEMEEIIKGLEFARDKKLTSTDCKNFLTFLSVSKYAHPPGVRVEDLSIVFHTTKTRAWQIANRFVKKGMLRRDSLPRKHNEKRFYLNL